IVVAYVIKVAPAVIFSKRFGLRESLGLGVLVTPGLSLTVAAAEIGFRMQLLTPATHAAMILLAIVAAALSPIIFERLAPAGAAEERERVVIVGADQKGLLLATRLADYGERLLLVDKDQERVEQAKSRGFQAMRANVFDRKEWEKIQPDAWTRIVVTTQVDETNLKVVETLASSFDVGDVIAYASDPESAAKMERLNARPVTAALSTLSVMENLVRHP